MQNIHINGFFIKDKKYDWFLLFVCCCFIFFTEMANSQPNQLEIGVAKRVITPEIGSWQQGSGVVRRGTTIHSELEANGVYLSNSETQILMISCDLGGLGYGFEVELREAIGVAVGISPRDVIISATHAHGGPSVLKHNYLMPIDTEYMAHLKDWLVDLAKEAVNSVQPGKIGWSAGELLIGHNRRFTWADGTHTMYGDATREDFTGLEGPVDPQHTAIFATDLNGKLLAILYNNTTHMSTFYGKGVFSAGFVGEVRKNFRREFNDGNLSILFLNGAQGDIGGITDRLDPNRQSETDEEKIERLGEMVFDKTINLYENVVFDEDPVLKHIYKDIKVGIRLPSTERLLEAREVLSKIDAGENIRGMEMIKAYGAIRLQEAYGSHPFELIPIHAIRIGELAIVTQPFELYSQFGLDMKRRSPVSTTMVVGLADGFHGYCPTINGILGGGYSAMPLYWTKAEPYAGYRVVETGTRLLYKLWAND